MKWPENLPPIRIMREGDSQPKMGTMPPNQGTESFFLQGRWWCAKCLVQWTGTWEVRDVAPHMPNGQEWAPVHDCGTVMIRTSGDERACAD